jgi:hypothetical protein
MDPDRRIQIVVGCSHDSRSGRSGRDNAAAVLFSLWVDPRT